MTYTLNVLKWEKVMVKEVLTSTLKMQAIMGKFLEITQMILIEMQWQIDELVNYERYTLVKIITSLMSLLSRSIHGLPIFSLLGFVC